MARGWQCLPAFGRLVGPQLTGMEKLVSCPPQRLQSQRHYLRLSHYRTTSKGLSGLYFLIQKMEPKHHSRNPSKMGRSHPTSGD